MAFGEILRNARIQRGLTPSDVAEGTRMLVQIVEGLEQEDFRRIAAPIYGRGFIKLYAEMMELDPDPLVADFMSLYNGARSPTVQTKKATEPVADESTPAPVPVTRTVSGTAPRVPQSADRPVVVKALDTEADDAQSDAGNLDAGTPDAGFPEFSTDALPPAVSQPEEPVNEMDDLDLFRAQSPQRKDSPQPVPALEPQQGEKPKRKFPIFQVGGRLDKDGAMADVFDEDASARRRARIQAFMDGIAKLKDGMGQRLADFPLLQQKQVWLIGGAGLMVVTAMIIGICTLFKMTGTNAQKPSVARVERVMPPPPLYVD